MDITSSLKEIPDAECKTFKITTSLGSVLHLLYRPTMIIEYEGQSCEQGDILLRGYSELAGHFINFAGIGFRPEEGNYITVKPFPDEEYDPADYTELIVNIKEL